MKQNIQQVRRQQQQVQQVQQQQPPQHAQQSRDLHVIPFEDEDSIHNTQASSYSRSSSQGTRHCASIEFHHDNFVKFQVIHNHSLNIGKQILVQEANAVKRRVKDMRSRQFCQQQQDQDHQQPEDAIYVSDLNNNCKRRKLLHEQEIARQEEEEEDSTATASSTVSFETSRAINNISMEELISMWNQAQRMKRLSMLFRQMESIQEEILINLESLANESTKQPSESS